MKQVLQAVLMLGAVVMSPGSLEKSIDYQQALTGIARDIASLKRSHPQLSEFFVEQNLQAKELKISYGYRTHRATHGGWTGGVPNPDADGIWFYIDFHDPHSTAQIHTQPVTAAICIGDKRVSFLSLEGTRTKSVSGAIHKILKKHGATDCARSHKG